MSVFSLSVCVCVCVCQQVQYAGTYKYTSTSTDLLAIQGLRQSKGRPATPTQTSVGHSSAKVNRQRCLSAYTTAAFSRGYHHNRQAVRHTDRHTYNKLQSDTADFAPVPPFGEPDETYASSLVLVNSSHYAKT